jgi:hypothetical protein
MRQSFGFALFFALVAGCGRPGAEPARRGPGQRVGEVVPARAEVLGGASSARAGVPCDGAKAPELCPGGVVDWPSSAR